MAQKINSSQLLNGIVKKRQGSSATDWSAAGTTSYDVSSSPVKIQVGRVQITADPFTITFPETFTNPPILVGNQMGNISANGFLRVNSTTASAASVSFINDSGTAITTQYVSWIAIGI